MSFEIPRGWRESQEMAEAGRVTESAFQKSPSRAKFGGSQEARAQGYPFLGSQRYGRRKPSTLSLDAHKPVGQALAGWR